MLLRKVSPVTVLDTLGREMDRVFGDLFSDNGGFLGRSHRFLPVNLWEEGDRFFVEAEVPGLKMEDLDVQVLGNEVVIKGRWEAIEDEKVRYRLRERLTGEFERTLSLPVEIDTGQVEAVLKNGVLRVTLPKAEVARAKKITVKALE